MKQLLFLFLFPCLCVAQYTGNGNQKITLGEQSTADGLVYRGLAADTTRKPSVDTMAYILLDTNTNIIWQYKKATSNAWLRLNLLPSDTSSMLTNYYRSGRALGTPLSATLTTATGLPLTSGITGTLPVANGGTNASTFTEGSVVFAGASGTYTQDNSNLFFDNTNNRLGIGKSNPTATVDISGPSSARAMAINGAGDGPYFSFSTSDTTFADIGSLGSLSANFADRFNFVINTRSVLGTVRSIHFQTFFETRAMVDGSGEFWIGYTDDGARGAYPLQINGQPYATSALYVPSDENYKENITPLNKGLEIVNKLNPVTFNFISDTKNNFSEYEEVGFIAQDVDRALSTETFAKSIVKAADDSEPTAKMGLMTQNLIPILVKAIQEQNLLIKALEQRILILENK